MSPDMSTTRSTPGLTVVLGAGAPALRRRLGPLAWCALEALHQLATLTDDALIADVSLQTLAVELGVAKNTAHRALKTLRGAGLIEHDQARAAAGLFDTSRYRLDVADDVLTHLPLAQPATATSSRRRVRSATSRRAAVAADAGGFVEQLVLLPER
jgi:IclR-like helix-turn-helix domain-containing protein